ncbi:phytanoyl-CoA dioxygenase family protein [Streptomyces sp. NPDC005953]|uniref:phytanoyl-CoA dioxygenase family protein n=1 Tax=Streptomyces sp. NPDC005953 TaxID=3156719 RepID=UPI0034109C5C
MSQQASPMLDTEQIAQFDKLGYLVLPAFLPPALVVRLEPEVDHWVDSGLRADSIAACRDAESLQPPPVMEIELPAHGELVAHPPLMWLLHQLMGRDFVFHHLHSVRLPPDAPGKSWHHDYEQPVGHGRSHLMVHALHYLGGLEASQGGLALLPGSHREHAEKAARARLGCSELPGEVLVNDLPRGSTVLIHSALFHTRRPPCVTGGEANRPRYLVDGSYCRTGVRWQPVKPYWRQMLSRARDLGLGHGQWPELFSDQHFTEYTDPN